MYHNHCPELSYTERRHTSARVVIYAMIMNDSATSLRFEHLKLYTIWEPYLDKQPIYFNTLLTWIRFNPDKNK